MHTLAYLSVPERIRAHHQVLRVATLLEEINVGPLPREGEPTIREAKEIFLLIVDKVRDPLLAQHHPEHVKGIGWPAPALLVTAKSTHSPSVTTRRIHASPSS